MNTRTQLTNNVKYDYQKFNILLEDRDDIDLKFYENHCVCHACYFLGKEAVQLEQCSCEKHRTKSEELLAKCKL